MYRWDITRFLSMPNRVQSPPMWVSLFIVAAVLLVVASGVCVWLIASGRAGRGELENKATEIDALKHERADLVAQLRESFKSLAGDVLKASKDDFLQLARKTFESEQKQAVGQLDQRKQAIEALLKPIRETLDKHAKAVTDIEKSREGAYQGLRQQMTSLSQQHDNLRDETANLVKALRRPEVRGAWGQMQLERVAELAGMIEHVTYDCEVTTDDGKLRADMIVKLPGDRQIVIDSKTPMDAFINAIEADNDQLREEEMDRHVIQIETKIKELASKRYQDQFHCADFVVMFIPGEAFLQPAVMRKPMLIEQAMEKNVIIATPTMLVALLKAVALGWQERQLAENARRIGELGQELHERIAVATNHVGKLGDSLGKAVANYNEFVGSLESRVLVTARKFKDLGADSAKEIPPTPPASIEIIPRQVRAVESATDDT